MTLLLLAGHPNSSAQISPGLSAKPANVTVNTNPPQIAVDLTKPDGLLGISNPHHVAPAKPLLTGLVSDAGGLDGDAQLSRAKQLLEERRPAEAWAILEYLLKEDPGLPGLHYQAALTAQRVGDAPMASSLAAQALARGEDRAPLQVLLGVLAMQNRKFADAEKAFERAIGLDPLDGVALYNLSEALREQGRPKEAIEALKRAQELEPKRKLLTLKIRLAQIETGESTEDLKIEVMKRKAEENQTEDWLMTAAAVDLMEGNYLQAIQALRKARSSMGADQVAALFSQDHFFREFADDKELLEIRQELGLD